MLKPVHFNLLLEYCIGALSVTLCVKVTKWNVLIFFAQIKEYNELEVLLAILLSLYVFQLEGLKQFFNKRMTIVT